MAPSGSPRNGMSSAASTGTNVRCFNGLSSGYSRHVCLDDAS